MQSLPTEVLDTVSGGGQAGDRHALIKEAANCALVGAIAGGGFGPKGTIIGAIGGGILCTLSAYSAMREAAQAQPQPTTPERR